MKKYFYRLLPICLFILVMTGCNDTETVISIGEARNLVAEISTQSAAIGDNVTFTISGFVSTFCSIPILKEGSVTDNPYLHGIDIRLAESRPSDPPICYHQGSDAL